MDILSEMRLFFPNQETEDDKSEKSKSESKKKNSKVKSQKEETKVSAENGGSSNIQGEENEDSGEGSEDDSPAPAQIFAEALANKANLTSQTGGLIASIDELPMLIPRGKFSFQIYEKNLKLHGKTHNYKIKYTQCN